MTGHRDAARDHRVDVWQTRMPWPATLAMPGSEPPDPTAPAAPPGVRAARATLSALDDRALVGRGRRRRSRRLRRPGPPPPPQRLRRLLSLRRQSRRRQRPRPGRVRPRLSRPGTFKGDAAFGTWLYRIAVNVCLTRAALKTPPLDPLEPLELADVRGDRPDDPLRRAQDAARVKAAIARLPTKQRMTVILRVYHELPHEEIARMLGSSVGAVKANFFHALQNLAQAPRGAHAMSHLSRDERLLALGRRARRRRASRTAMLPGCRAEVEALRGVLREVRAVDVPEPSPLFWDHLSARVGDAIAREPAPARAARMVVAASRPGRPPPLVVAAAGAGLCRAPRSPAARVRAVAAHGAPVARPARPVAATLARRPSRRARRPTTGWALLAAVAESGRTTTTLTPQVGAGRAVDSALVAG